MATRVLYFGSDYIKNFLGRNPVSWEGKHLAGLGGAGDTAGPTPEPAAQAFLDLLTSRNNLFSQSEYVVHCIDRWHEWLKDKTPLQVNGVKAKLSRNFYPSFIDSIHVWALLSETKMFDMCFIDSYDDAVAKTDITVISSAGRAAIALCGLRSRRTTRCREHKKAYRGGTECYDKVIEVYFPFERKMRPGNKRWYELNDFRHLELFDEKSRQTNPCFKT